jgi:glycosyltransferase involved in cell wall biosynthesis
MRRIHILTPAILPGDAVSNDVLGMLRWFRQRGFEAHVYTSRAHWSLRQKVRPLDRYHKYLRRRTDVMIYHHSVGWPAGSALFQETQNRKVLRYHNVTPPEFYCPYNVLFAHFCAKGVRETRRLLALGPEWFLADSEFNARGLTALGVDPELCRAVPPFHRIGTLDALPLDNALAAELQERKNLLFVGRLAPNKGHLHLIRALAYYRHHLAGQAHLVLVGGLNPGLNNYCEELHEEARRHRLHDYVHFAGRVSNRQIRTYYTHASIFLCASEHEGFCVPLTEAMYYGIPVVAYGGSAVADTLGDTGLVWEAPTPAVFAESIREIEARPGLREALTRNQRARFDAHFAINVIERRLDEALAPLLRGAMSHA